MKHPFVSIITVCYNAADVIEMTLKSIRRQEYDNFEYIVIDGASTDGTQEILLQNRDIITKYISEKDNGIYDAMNKGLYLAQGDYVWFINAGDKIPHKTTLLDIMESSILMQDIYCGQTKIINKSGEKIGKRRLKLPKTIKKNSFLWGMVVCHQSFIVKRSIVSKYDTSYRHCADFDWMLKAVDKADKQLISRSSHTFSYFLEGGHASQNVFKANWERFEIMIKHFGPIKAIVYNFLMLFRFIWAKITHKQMA
ncbi:MAG: glycosyltransferase [Bacteroidales bacterium]|nr:glycosyltransferase [Bacteroidales bacterium]